MIEMVAGLKNVLGIFAGLREMTQKRAERKDVA